MFTGLVEDVGTVQQLQHRAPQSVLLLRCGRLDPATLVLGESIAVNGACLTVSSRTGGGFAAEASPETLARTTLGGLRPGERVHLERALRLGDRLGGHLVLGHVDGVGRVARIEQQGELRRLSVHCPPELRRLLVGKGSVAVDGVSLTV
ncbi:MAG: riboflavin synthase, partial [Deltaproteobacteria bacterium]|nr:riboflavin synthase [Deltaproteobacteria bacterium]